MIDATETMSIDEALSTLRLRGAPAASIETAARTLSHLRVMLAQPDGDARVKNLAHQMVREMGLHPFEVAWRLSAYLRLLAAAPPAH